MGVDEDLIAAAVAGDRYAQATFVRTTQLHVWRYCAYLAPGTDTEDLVQETYARALASLHRYRAEASARTWLLAIARRVCADAHRSARRQRLLQTLLNRTSSVSDGGETLALTELVDRLAPDRREAFVLTQLVGLSYAEAAALTRCEVGTIRSRVARARLELQQQVRHRAG